MHGLGSKHDKRVQAAPSNPSMWWRLRGQGEDGDEEEDEELEGGGDTVGEEVLEPRKDLARDPDRNDAHAAIAAQWLLHINIRNITLCTQCHLTMSDFRIATVHMLPQLTRTRAERAFERFMQGVTERRGAAASEAPMRTRKVSRNERSADADEQGQRRRHRGGAQRHAPQALAGKDDVGSGASRVGGACGADPSAVGRGPRRREWPPWPTDRPSRLHRTSPVLCIRSLNVALGFPGRRPTERSQGCGRPRGAGSPRDNAAAAPCTAMPTSARLRAGASLTPSPVMPHRYPT